jgi:hypothetical protein
MTRSITNILEKFAAPYSRSALKEEAGRFFWNFGNIVTLGTVLHPEEDARYSHRAGSIKVHIRSSSVV